MLLRTLLRHGLPLVTAVASVLIDDGEPLADVAEAPAPEAEDEPTIYLVEKITALVVDKDGTA